MRSAARGPRRRRSSADGRAFRWVGLALALVAGLAAGSESAAAQAVPTTAIGLGYPTPPLDARAAALGGVGVGLLGGTTSVRNPADLIEFRVPVLSGTTAPQSVTLQGNGLASAHEGRSTFPVLGIAVPIAGFAFGVGVSQKLDQDWSLRFVDTLDAASGKFPYVDRREHNGGVSAIDLAVARRLGPLSVGFGYDRLVGSLRETFNRQFQPGPDSTISPPSTVNDQALWNYHGSQFRVGAGVQLGERVRVSGVYSWSTSLRAEQDSIGTTRNFDMPRWFAVGASARPVQDLLLTVGGGWSGWSTADREVSGTRARNVRWGGAGLEFTGWKIGSFPVALRAGGHITQLPFWQVGHAPLDEKAISFGLGTQFANDRGRLDFSLEVGKRGNAPATGTAETFRRFTLTFTVRQIPTPGFLP